jgi:hypothetical protein
MIESMDHLASEFTSNTNEPHHTQHNFTELKVKLIYVVEVPPEDESYTALQPFKFISIRIPARTPIYRVRDLYKHLDEKLSEMYPKASRLDFVSTAPAGSNVWDLEFNIPVYRVVYV